MRAGDHPLADLTERTGAAPPRCGDVRVLLLDGPSGSGKTTLADRLGPPVLHMDELYPGWDGLEASVPVLVDVLARLAAGGPLRYRRWDWTNERWGAEVERGRPSTLVVEGVGSGARGPSSYASLLVWLDAPEPDRYARAIARDGETYRPHWARWAEQERAHFAREQTEARADVRLTS